MCRFLVYKGRACCMADLLSNTKQSLIRQSQHSTERLDPLNGDGFGVGWYDQEIDATPCVFTSITPAWSNRNLARLSPKIHARCFFAHVRAASPGLPVTDLDCHPFQYEQFLWMHNGHIPHFTRLKRHFREPLRDELYRMIQGNTDSEHAFALFLNHLWGHIHDYSLGQLRDAMIETLRQISELTSSLPGSPGSQCNFALTDGHSILVTRYADKADETPPSLYIIYGDRFQATDGGYTMAPATSRVQSVIIASEPLTQNRTGWQAVPANHMVMVSPELHIKMVPLE